VILKTFMTHNCILQTEDRHCFPSNLCT
jgi:hypothetical protein